MSFAEIQNEHRRLAILQLLAQTMGYDVNEHLLAETLKPFGHRPGRDLLRTDLFWLQEQGLLQVSKIGEELHLAKLTARGADVSAGRVVVPGVRRPGPDEVV